MAQVVPIRDRNFQSPGWEVYSVPLVVRADPFDVSLVCRMSLMPALWRQHRQACSSNLECISRLDR